MYRPSILLFVTELGANHPKLSQTWILTVSLFILQSGLHRVKFVLDIGMQEVALLLINELGLRQQGKKRAPN